MGIQQCCPLQHRMQREVWQFSSFLSRIASDLAHIAHLILPPCITGSAYPVRGAEGEADGQETQGGAV